MTFHWPGSANTSLRAIGNSALCQYYQFKLMASSQHSLRQRQELRRIALDFHRRAFGDEMARVNFLPLAKRKAYLRRLRSRIQQQSGSQDKSAESEE